MEIFKDVIGFEELFQVSNLGRVFSKRTNKFLKQVKSPTGYLTIPTKIGGRQGKCILLRVHRLVAEAFLEPPCKSLVDKCSKEHYGKVLVLHKDNDKSNNNVSNLEWGDSYTNTTNAKRDGILKTPNGSTGAKTKFTEDQIIEMRRLYASGDYNYREIGDRFGVSRHTARKIILKLIWAHIE